MPWGSKVTITVHVILEPIDQYEEALHIGFRGPGGWYEPSNQTPQYETINKFKALRYSGPHYVDAITTAPIGGADVRIRSARTLVGVGRKDKTITMKPKL